MVMMGSLSLLILGVEVAMGGPSSAVLGRLSRVLPAQWALMALSVFLSAFVASSLQYDAPDVTPPTAPTFKLTLALTFSLTLALTFAQVRCPQRTTRGQRTAILRIAATVRSALLVAAVGGGHHHWLDGRWRADDARNGACVHRQDCSEERNEVTSKIDSHAPQPQIANMN